MDYSFNGEIAARYGVDEAVFIHNLYWWIAKNEANGRHHYDGRSWTYNTAKAFSELFPFWSEKQVRRIVEKLRSNGAIYIGNYNEKAFDRTQWFALSEEVLGVYEKGKCIFPFGQMEVTKRANGFAQTGTPIPDSKPDSKPDIEREARVKGHRPPTLEEVQSYCKERHSNVDAKRFFDYFEAADWVDSKGNRVRNWKQKLITWEQHEPARPVSQAYTEEEMNELLDDVESIEI